MIQSENGNGRLIEVAVIVGLAGTAIWTLGIPPDAKAIDGSSFFALHHPLPFLLAFARIHGSQLLVHPVRAWLASIVKERPGRSFTELRLLGARRTGKALPAGTLTHHLTKLAAGGFIGSHRDGKYRRFFAADAPTETKIRVRVLESPPAAEIIAVVAAVPGINQKQLLARLDAKLRVTRSGLIYHLELLRAKGILTWRRVGRTNEYAVTLETPI